MTPGYRSTRRNVLILALALPVVLAGCSNPHRYDRLNYWERRLQFANLGDVEFRDVHGSNSFSSDPPTLLVILKGDLTTIRAAAVQRLTANGFADSGGGKTWRSEGPNESRVVYVLSLKKGSTWSLPGANRTVSMPADSIGFQLQVSSA